MSGSPRTGYGNTDSAALGAATLAVAFPMFGDEGPFEPLSMVLSLTLVFLVLGYVWGHQKTTTQVVAVAATLALVTTPILGFMLEFLLADDRTALLECGYTKACSGAEDEDLGKVSNVRPWGNTVIWFYVFFAAWKLNKKEAPPEVSL